jgi:hypothetical protein
VEVKMFHVNESLTINRNEDGSVDLNLQINLATAITIKVGSQDWRHIVEAFPAEGESMFDEARKAHEKYVQLPIEHQFQIGINVGVITDADAKQGDAIKLHNAFLKMIFGGEADLEKTNTFIDEVNDSWEKLHK